MILKSILLSVFLMTSIIGQSQVNLNEYKYVVVPKKLDGLKKENQYQTSTLITYLFTNKGFLTVYDDDLPSDLNKNRCLGLYVDLINKSTMFTTKTILILKDCSNQEILTTQEGRSKKKNYKESYNEALSMAFSTMNVVSYEYALKAETQKEAPIIANFKNDIKTLENKPLANDKTKEVVQQVATKEVQSYEDKSPIESDYKSSKPIGQKESVEQIATKEEQSFKNMAPVQSKYVKGESTSASKVTLGTLYAQELSNGYQLVDSTPKIQLKIFKSSMPNVYIAHADQRDGVVYSSDGKWFFEYQDEGQVVKEELTIKF